MGTDRFFRRLFSLLQAQGELVKLRLSLLVVITAAAGFFLSGPVAGWEKLAWTLTGTFLAAAGAMALNEVWEVERDRRMPRTAHRPLVTGFFSRSYGLLFGLGSCLAGLVLLAWRVHWLPALLGLVVVLLYVLVYTPLKTQTPFCTLVGAVCGALPPMMGWSGACGRLGGGAWLLAALLFFWQIPHFLSLAWLYKDQYRQGGFCMLPEKDPHGHLTGRFSLLYALATVATAFTFVTAQLAGPVFAAVAALLGAAFLLPALRLASAPTPVAAKRLFLATLLYLPLLLAALVLDRQVRETPLVAASASHVLAQVR
jgi:protoheme IX farnesyltransferase